MSKARKGSILFTSISMVSVFLTLVVAATAYVNQNQRTTLADRFRDTAEQAARSGLEWVMGYAQENIDTETRLPREWGRMADGDVINPVAVYLKGKAVAAKTSVSAVAPGDMLGDCNTTAVRPPANLAGVGEYVLSVQGKYVVTFKARVQQYRYAESMPRQYRIGVVGRVRVNDPRRNLTVNANEKDSIVAESFIMSNIGQVPTSRYAALIDIDGVRNWVPGEVVNGPVHVNRGYIDSLTETTTGTPGGTRYIDVGVPDVYTGSFNYNYTGPNTVPAARAGSFFGRDIRSTMNIRTSMGSPFGQVSDPIYGTMKAPRFNDEVSMTVVDVNDDAATKAVYKNLDPHNATAGIASGGVGQGTGVLIDGNAYSSSALPGGLAWTDIFQAPENQTNDTKHFGTPGVGAGPTVLSQPVAMPTSVRNRLMTVVGSPVSMMSPSLVPNWAALPDGVYIPTTGFWDWQTGAGPSTSGYPNNTTKGYCVGGIYVRGNVEVMRMGVDGQYSYYLFQLGFGGPQSATNPKRTYLVLVDRTNRDMWLCAYQNTNGLGYHRTIPGIGVAGGNTNLAGLLAAGGFGGIPGTGATLNNNTTDPQAFAMSPAFPPCNQGNISAHFPPPPTAQPFPFNGVVFVDMARLDYARDTTNPNTVNNFPPITGNIFALGDPGASGNAANKRTIESGVAGIRAPNAERVATYQGVNPTNTASSLTIMAVGNIFVQNDIVLDSIDRIGGITTFPGLSFNDATKVTLNNTRDLLGLVSDKQVVLGLAAPSTLTRANAGVSIHGAIAALGDPGYDYTTQQANPQYMKGNDAYRGSFSTEGLMQYYNLSEDYLVCDGGPNNLYAPTAGHYLVGKPRPANANAGAAAALLSSQAIGEGPDPNGYPGIPLYKSNGGDGWAMPFDTFINNPNGANTRGRAVVFGSVTVKKRGIIGKGDTSYDKRFLFDRRLLTIAPPIFPSSTNVVVRTTNPVPPMGLPYFPGPLTGTPLDFMI